MMIGIGNGKGESVKRKVIRRKIERGISRRIGRRWMRMLGIKIGRERGEKMKVRKLRVR